MVLWLPGRPVVRREILRLEPDAREWILRPDLSGAGISLKFGVEGMLLNLAGPERADVELELLVHAEGCALALWGVAQGPQAEITLWDSFGRLAVPDVLARTPDCDALVLPAGRFVLQASVQGRSSAMVGVGLDAVQAHAWATRRAAG